MTDTIIPSVFFNNNYSLTISQAKSDFVSKTPEIIVSKNLGLMTFASCVVFPYFRQNSLERFSLG
jgi:hypothetical protein